MTSEIKEKIKRALVFFAGFAGVFIFAIAAHTWGIDRESFSSGQKAQTFSYDAADIYGDPTEVVQFEEGLARLPGGTSGTFGSEDITFPNTSVLDTFTYDAADIYGDPTQVTQFEEGLERFGIPENTKDITFGAGEIISGPEGEIPGITETIFGLEDYFGDFSDPGRIIGGPEGEIPGVTESIFGGAQDAAETISGGVRDAVQSVFDELGLGDVLGDLGIDNILGGAGGVLSGGVGGAVGGITGLFGGGGAFVPVKDFTQIALQQRQVTKEYNLDPVAYLAAKTSLRGILGNVLSFVNTGDNGNPFYVTNTTQHFQNVERSTIEKFLGEIRILGINPNVQRSIAINASPQFSNTIRPTISASARNSFLQDFSNGGWDAWSEMLKPQNNPLGQYLLTSTELERRKNEAALREAQELQWGRGYKSAKVCLLKDVFGNCLYNEIVTPGSFIENQQAAVFSSIIRQLEADDELQEVTSALLSNMLNQILGGRKTGLRGFSPQIIASPVADTAAINRTKAGLQDAINVMFQDEAEYLSKKSSSLVRLNQAKDSFETLLPPRVYNFTDPLKSRVSASAELSQTVEANRSYATSTINQLVVPAQRILASDIIISSQLIDKIKSLARELAAATTPNQLAAISNKYLDLSRSTHGKPALEKVDEESKILSDFSTGAINEVSSRFSKENDIIEKIKAELFPPTSN